MNARSLRNPGIALLLSALLGVQGCTSEPNQENLNSSVGLGSKVAQATVGRFHVTVDPRAKEPLSIVPVKDLLPGNKLLYTPADDPGNTVLDAVTLSGQGVWDDAAQTLTAPVVITHAGGLVGDLDEVQLVVTDLSDLTGTVTFESSNNLLDGLGAVVAFADLERPTSTTKCASGSPRASAGRPFVIRDTDPSTTFSFTVDVRARQNSTPLEINPDCDGDGFNVDRRQDAGDDCDDEDPAVIDCTCPANINGSNNYACLNPDTRCVPPLGGLVTCGANSACVCNINGDGFPNTRATCRSDCNVTCDAPVDGLIPPDNACAVDCRNDGTICNFDCSNAQDGECVASCRGGSVCNVTCEENVEDCTVTSCTGGSSCALACTGANSDCGITACRNDSTCDVNCTGDFATCGIGRCMTGSSCSVTCGGPEVLIGEEEVGVCTINCSSGAADCSMDCSNIPEARRDETCQLLCVGAQVRQLSIENGRAIYRCVPS